MVDVQDATVDERQLVVFRLANQVYGVDTASVREIVRMQEVTHVPGAAEFIQGVTNLRGQICPVVDLRTKLGVALSEQTNESRIVILDVMGEAVGAVVDTVTEVLRIPSDSVEPAPEAIARGASGLVAGVVNAGERLIMLIDVERALRRTHGAAPPDLETTAA